MAGGEHVAKSQLADTLGRRVQCHQRLAVTSPNYRPARNTSPPPPPPTPPKEDLCFQGIDQELAGLPGCYAAPAGRILLAARPGGAGGEPPEYVGCVAVRPLEKEGGGGEADAAAENRGKEAEAGPPGPVCEMKRLWVGGGARGTGAGRRLVAAAVGAGREMGYKSIVLDTLERLEAANGLYEAAGFRRRGAYYHNPLPNVVYWELDL
jgi:putative acetyltransferase